MKINYNGKDYIATYNSQSGYYEIELDAPETGGIYKINIQDTDILNKTYDDSVAVQVFHKEKIKLEMNKVFMWIFDCFDFSVKDVVELADFEINIDEETNSNSLINVKKKTSAKAGDIVAIKRNNEIIYWGTIDNIENENGSIQYQYTLKYITNLFDQEVELINGKRIDDNYFEGVYSIGCIENQNMCLDVNLESQDNNGEVVISQFHSGYNQKFFIKEVAYGEYTIRALHSNKLLTLNENNKIVQYEDCFVTEPNGEKFPVDNQIWQIEKNSDGTYSLWTLDKDNNHKYLDIYGNYETAGTILQGFTRNDSNAQKFYLSRYDDDIIKKVGIEDFISVLIKRNFIENKDTFINKNYLIIDVKTHTPKEISVTNVENNIFNLHTWITNCTQNYDIIYNITSPFGRVLKITIENKTSEKQLIDTQANAISDYSEVFETNVISKVIVLTTTDTYTLYLLNDRTTTTDMSNQNRASGKTKTVFTENFEDARQTALDVFKSNSYNHNITFKYYNKFIQVGTPVIIKTKESLLYNTYISAVKITQNKFIEYTCGNIRMNFIDKLLKERKT